MFTIHEIFNDQITYLKLPTLQQGDDGETVASLQNILQLLGYYIDLGDSIDGIFGLQTKMAVENFQNDEGLLVDGIVSYQTWKILGLRCQQRLAE